MGRIAITGANSAVGCEMLRCGGELVACVRSDRAERELPEFAGDVARVDYGDGSSLTRAFSDVEAVAHLPGVLIESAHSSYEQANVETTRAVLAGAVECGVRKFVLVSAIGADPASPNRYYQSKGRAEELVRASPLAWTILRAPLVLGPGTEGAVALRRNSAASVARLLGGGQHLQQPLDVGDLARAALSAANLETARDRVLEIAGPEVLSDAELVQRAARAQGREVRIRGVPIWLTRGLLRLRGLVRGPGLSPDVLEVITTDTEIDPKPASDALGIELTAVDTMVKRSLEDA